ncbi:putative pectinesterase [Helianthus debilis subsp. tardiflorus]
MHSTSTTSLETEKKIVRHVKDLFAGKKMNFSSKRSKLVLIAFVSLLLLVSAIVGIAVGVNKSGESSSAAHAVVKSSCSSTFYPELCYSTITSHPQVTTKAKTQKDVIELTVKITESAVQKNYFQIKKLITRKGLTPRGIGALHNCLQMVSETLEELGKVTKDLEEYQTKKSLRQHANDLKTLMSSAITDQETCLDGFSHDDADKKVRKELEKGQVKVEKMCSNALAMICNMTDTDIANENKLNGRNLKEEEKDWPEWLSAGDRKLLQSGTVRANVVVAADGSGNYKTVAAAVADAPSKSSSRYVIRIKAGVYRENVVVPNAKTNLMFMGDGRNNTIITGSLSVKGGNTTFDSATVAIGGDGFLGRDITFENTAGASNKQAVALRVSSDFSAFYQCDMLAYQDTLYVHKNRQFYIHCLVVGTVDFIFGNAAAVLQDCDIEGVWSQKVAQTSDQVARETILLSSTTC